MNKPIATAIAAVVIALTATPAANAKALRDPSEKATPVAACARIVMSKQGDCQEKPAHVHLKKHRHQKAAQPNRRD
jgi:hypothetical protein